jgi:hypothetical protein
MIAELFNFDPAVKVLTRAKCATGISKFTH